MDKKLPIGEGTKINGTSEWEKTAKAAATTVPVREMEEIVDIKNFSPVSKRVNLSMHFSEGDGEVVV
ncbi:hypothetical protein SCA6_013101 [Theobroma cacao]